MGLPECGIPDSDLPQCWTDDVRMNALFAPFRIKTANPESWDMKMKFWSDMVRQWCRCRKDPIVSAADAKAAFTRKGRTPACIEIVVEEMFRNGDLSPISKYHQILHNGPEGWVKWGARIAFRPAAFALTAVASLLPAKQAVDTYGLPKASIESTQRFVLESAVKDQATELLQSYPPGAERIGTIDELMKVCNWHLTRETFEILLGYLVSQGTAVKKDDVVKLAEPDKKATPVTETDEALVKLMSAEARLEADIVRAAREAAAAEADARAALQVGNRTAAKNHLRRKHKSNTRLQRSTAALANVQQLLQHARDVSEHAQILDTYKTSTAAMKQGMKETGLTEDEVHDTMDDLREVMDTYNEVEKTLGQNTDDLDMAELEEELKELMSRPGAPTGGTPGKEERKEGLKIPSPPRGKPSRKVSERDFVFDGEERMLAELNDLDIEENSPGEQNEKKKVAVLAEGDLEDTPEEARPDSATSKGSMPWYPPSGDCLRPEAVWSPNNNDASLSELTDFGELRQDDRIHPGQQLNVDFTSPPRLYNADFQVRDHKRSDGVWLFNTRDCNDNTEGERASELSSSTENPSESDDFGFQMAPGGERKKSLQPGWPSDSQDDDLERRLKNLRGFNL